MKDKEVEKVLEEFRKQLRLAINIDDVTTAIRNDNAQTILNLIEKLQKENEELKETYKSEKKMKNEYVKLYQDLLLKENVIPVQKVKDKIEEYKNMLKICNKAKDIDRIKAINERILELQELIEEEK